MLIKTDIFDIYIKKIIYFKNSLSAFNNALLRLNGIF